MSTTIKLLQANLKKLRKQAGLTQLKLSIMTGFSKDYITAIELGRCVPSIKNLDIIAKALNVEFYKLFIDLS